MNDFLIKSTLSLFLLLVVYHLALEKEKMHQFNRFYLLFSLVFSFAIPFITIEIIDKSKNAILQTKPVITGLATMAIAPESVPYTTIILWSLYSIITSLLFFRFVRNILKITSRIQLNTVVNYKNAKLILLKEKTLPHTFWNNIYINETDYNSRKIEEELYTHELIHVTQKHTLDILIIEIIKTVFWFNPLFIFYKKAIQLNHEFLADEKVVNSYNNVPLYQSLLLSKANENQPFYLASNLNYLVTKKRFLMMTKTTSKTKEILKKIALIPIFTGLTFLVCVETVAQEKKATTVKSNTPLTGMEEYFKNTTFLIKDKKGNIVDDKKFSALTTEEMKQIPPPPPPAHESKNQTTQQVEEAKKIKGPKYVEIKPEYVEEKPVEEYQENQIYNTAGLTEKPDFPGGMEEFYKFVGKNYRTPEQPNLKGKVYVTFIIEKDGSISDVKTIRDIGYGTGEEAIRVLKLCPKWTPGKMEGIPVRVLYSLPITLQSAK